jgi:nitroreductase
MDAYEAIVNKRDRRDYQDKPIPQDVLRRILQAGRMAGSSSNTQPLRFIVLQDPKGEVRQKLAGAGAGTGPLVKAPLGIVIALKRGSRDFDVGRAAQNMMVAAWAEGIVSCPVGMPQEAVASEALGLPEDFLPAIGVAFGYPGTPDPNAPLRPNSRRLPLEELVHHERWGG